MTAIKNCGLKTQEAVTCAIANEADYLGFVLYPPSVRAISAQEAHHLTQQLPSHVQSVAVLVNPTDEDIRQLLGSWQPDILQLHGDESPERANKIKQQTQLPIIKAIGIATAADIDTAQTYENIADHLLLDTKSPDYGGTGQTFDWSLIQQATFKHPWFLSGGLNTANITEALAQTHAPMVDVSSGIEREKGVKDLAAIQSFNQAVKHYDATQA